MGKILLTGATGFVGGQVLRALCLKGDESVIAVVRPDGKMGAAERMTRVYAMEPAILEALADGRVTVVEGDVTLPLLGLSEAALEQVTASVDRIIHTAADVRLNQAAATYEAVNVQGTAHVLELARRVNAGAACAGEGAGAGEGAAEGNLKRLVHVSTGYVAGTLEGEVPEAPLAPVGFNSLYEESKYRAEELVRAAAAEFPVSVVRPGQIIGRSTDGFITTFNTVYYPLKMYLKGKLPVVPVKASQTLNVVPVDYVVDVVLASLAADEPGCSIAHAMLPAKELPTVGQVMAMVQQWAADNLGVKLSKPAFIPVSSFAKAGAKRNIRDAGEAKPKSYMDNMLSLAPYFLDRHVFATEKAGRLVPSVTYNWQEFFPRMLEYATAQGFRNHSGRTVFEQMLVRFRGSKNTITYTDVTATGMVPVDAVTMEARIMDAASALLAAGIRKGDRVALAGVNSSDYLAADAAIGLIGAVSVPLYFTTPADEVEELLERSCAKLFLVGSAKLGAATAQGRFKLPCVILPQAEMTADAFANAGENITAWADFLALGRENRALLDAAPAATMTDPATIRYTSGTTGKPKGTTFTHQQLVWMAQTMGSVLDWQTRNGKIRYLSFLPMSHVVEGILVAYAPYFLLTDISVFCLNRFDALTDTLPLVNPSIFFSVPRFYEKLWDTFAATGAGKKYIAMADGPVKRAFAKICKPVLLKKAGLKDCRQLIVGSAPMSPALMQTYRELGIEVHNAFGLTEAPLITLNRLGANDMGSLGQPLPETELRIAEDGRILMKGPQLTIGYDGLGPMEVDENGFFDTGDLGHWSEAGNVVIEGRKKELLVTSYGKNVQPSKVEAMLKSVAGISEALLVGDARPYCTAVIWLEEGAAAGMDFEALDAEICAVNRQLSHPESAKRWLVLDGALSVAAGELTPNLKLRRNVMVAKCAPLLDELYAGTARVGGNVLHVGAFGA